MYKFQDEYNSSCKRRIKKNLDSKSYVEWLEGHYGATQELRDALFGINAMIQLYVPDIVWYDNMPITEAIGILIAKATHEKVTLNDINESEVISNANFKTKPKP